MQYRRSARTGLRVSIAGSAAAAIAAGLGSGKSEDEAVALIRAALDLELHFSTPPRRYDTERSGSGSCGVPRESV